MPGEEGNTHTPATCVSTQDAPGGSGSSPGAPAAPGAAVTTPAPAAPGQATPPSETPAISPGQSTLTDWTVAKGSANALNACVEMNSPKPSSQDRPRKVRKVSGAASTASAGDKGKLRATRNHGNNKPKTVSARTRILQFPGQGFSESFGKLYCRPCAKEISMDKETAVSHCGLAKSRKAGTKNRHEIKLSVWNERNGEAPGRLSRLEAWGKETYGRSTPKATQLQRTAVRVQVLESWLTAGLAIARLDDVRQLFIDLGVDMVDSSKFAGASASSALEIDSRSECSCSEDSESDDNESESDNGHGG